MKSYEERGIATPLFMRNIMVMFLTINLFDTYKCRAYI